MKQPGEELQETLTELDDRVVVDYLIKNFEFFIRNAHAVEAVRVPHPIRDIVSLVEWHMVHVRNHIYALEGGIVLLMGQAIVNEGLLHRPLYLQHSLTVASSPDDALMHFHRRVRDLGLVGTNLRLLPDRWRLGAPPSHTHLALSRQSFKPLRIQRLGQGQHYLEPFDGLEPLAVLPGAKTAGSVAVSMLGSDADLGVVLSTSRNASHYQQGQRTQLLHEVALVLPELLERWIERV